MKKPVIIVVAVLVMVVTVAFGLLRERPDPGTSEGERPGLSGEYRRIISMNPGTTEVLYALGLGDRIVGVSRFCKYPPDVRNKPDVGGYIDPNYEAIARLEPDLVILLREQENVRRYLAELGIATLTVSNKTVDEIIGSILTIGKACGADSAAGELADDIRRRIKTVAERNRGRVDPPRVLISVERTIGEGAVRDVYVAGRNTFFDELINAAGGINAFEGDLVPYPVISAEGLLSINPDIIIDMVPDLEDRKLDLPSIKSEWGSAGKVNAVKTGRVHVLSDDYIFIPGPRFILLLEDMARLFGDDPGV